MLFSKGHHRRESPAKYTLIAWIELNDIISGRSNLLARMVGEADDESTNGTELESTAECEGYIFTGTYWSFSGKSF